MSNDKVYNSVRDYFVESTSISVFVDGNESGYDLNTQEYAQILGALRDITENCLDMPAYGVSLDTDTRLAREKGVWIELHFNGVCEYNEMPFESLLIEVNSEYTGFNLHRKYKDKYEGRCFYLRLNGNMQTLNNTIEFVLS